MGSNSFQNGSSGDGFPDLKVSVECRVPQLKKTQTNSLLFGSFVSIIRGGVY